MTTCQPERLLDELSRLEALRDPEQTGSHNRQFKRFIIRGEAELHPISRTRLDRDPIDITLRDIGRSGFGFLSPQPLAPGSNWRVSFLRHGYIIGEQALMVRHCRAVANDLYLVGAQFVIDTGLLTQLGIDPGTIHDEDSVEEILPGEESISFLPPGDVA